MDPADLEDVASEKALEILLRAESGAWDSAGRSCAEIRGYVATAARNGWIDLVQRSMRERRIPEGVVAEPTTDPPEHARVVPEDPVARAEARELAVAVRDCAERLPARERRVWFFRAYYEMSSRDIASHPGVRLKASHVDVLVRRARLTLRECLRRRGHLVDDAPRSAFVELWNLLETLAEREPLDEPYPESGT